MDEWIDILGFGLRKIYEEELVRNLKNELRRERKMVRGRG